METRKRIRLAPSTYTGRNWYFLTACTQHRAPFFNQPPLAESMVQILITAAAHRNFLLHAWCVMPDHVHILCQGANHRSSVCMFVNRWKVKSSGTFQRELGRNIWQRSFHDHVLRPKEQLSSFLWYIWMNPVRKGLCKDPHRISVVRIADNRLEASSQTRRNVDAPMEGQRCRRGGPG